VTPVEFIKKWQASTLKERSGSQSHFNDLCHLVNEPTPTDADPDGTWYTFERGAKKTGGGDGWADVWKRGHFAWEYKGKHKDLNAAFAQLQRYAIALENPPLLIVSDMESIQIYTNFTNTVQDVTIITLDDLLKPEAKAKLKAIFNDPEQFRPGVTRETITAKAAEHFAQLAQALRARGFEPHRVAHFMNKMLFCMFAEDAGLLPTDLFKRMLETSVARPERFEPMARELFAAMKDGGNFGPDLIDWFNGGLFNDNDVLPLNQGELKIALSAAKMYWRDVEPSIFGTLFMRGLDPDKRSQLGAEYTDTKSIMRIVNPVIVDPLLAEWAAIKTEISGLLHATSMSKATQTKNYKKANSLYMAFLERLKHVRVLDPACGSGNFLYLALTTLKDLEQRIILEAEMLGLQAVFPSVGPEAVKGIEINPYAAELARVTIWIGQIQWMLRHGFSLSKNPILKPLNQIECRDALLNVDGSEAAWPEADIIIGNPPFLGGSGMLGEDYTKKLRDAYAGRVPGGADLVTYWYEKTRGLIEHLHTRRAGLVATQAIRAGSNRKILERIYETGAIFTAWSDEPWVVDGANVRVSIVCFTNRDDFLNLPIMLNGEEVPAIQPDLTREYVGRGLNITDTGTLKQNAGISFEGTKKYGAFDIPGDLAREWLKAPFNPNGKANSDVLRPWANGKAITARSPDTWIIDFGTNMTEGEAALYELPYQYALKNVKPVRSEDRNKKTRELWWLYERTRPELRKCIAPLTRYIITPRVAKHRLFAWMDARVIPDSRLYVIARDDDTTFGILHSRFHELWSLRQCSWHGVGNDPTYNAHSCFETFPFPDGLTPDVPPTSYAKDSHAVAIAVAARELNKLRDNWLNPSNVVQRVSEVVPGYPERIIPVDAAAATLLKKRTLTNLYNEKPTWLVQAHERLNAAVAAAYGWPTHLSDEDVIERILDLNNARSS
jgi:type II restriction/modification system DNA methylase subunit YeeA